jgi:predicted nucleic-acid-binding protein
VFRKSELSYRKISEIFISKVANITKVMSLTQGYLIKITSEVMRYLFRPKRFNVDTTEPQTSGTKVIMKGHFVMIQTVCHAPGLRF